MTVTDLVLKHSGTNIELVCNEKGSDGSIRFVAWSTNQDLVANHGDMKVVTYHTEIRNGSTSIFGYKPVTWIVANVKY